MGFNQAGDDIAPAGHFCTTRREHGKGFADTGRSAQINLQTPPPFLFGKGQQGVWRSSLR
jgi:hypothetical protein